MWTRLSNTIAGGALVTIMALCGGCTAAAVAVLPAAVGTAPVVVERFGTGAGNSFWVAEFDDVVAATLRAGEVLALELREQTIEEDHATLLFVDDKDAEITLRIDRRTATVTRIRYDVESNDHRGLVRLMGRQIVDELFKADAFLVDWSDPTAPPTD